jgi:hypothetical protein
MYHSVFFLLPPQNFGKFPTQDIPIYYVPIPLQFGMLFIEYDDLQEVYQISKKRPLFGWSSVIVLNVFENCSGAHHCSAHF